MLIAKDRIEKGFEASISDTQERPVRSFAKALSWRITGSLDTMAISWVLTGSVNTAVAIGLTEVVTKTFLYYFHERLWSRIKLGYSD